MSVQKGIFTKFIKLTDFIVRQTKNIQRKIDFLVCIFTQEIFTEERTHTKKYAAGI